MQCLTVVRFTSNNRIYNVITGCFEIKIGIGLRANFSRGGAEPSVPEKKFDSARKKLLIYNLNK